LPSNGTREPCKNFKNCNSTRHGNKRCPSHKCYEKNCGKTFASADERKAHFIQEHGFMSKPTTPPLKSSLKEGNKIKFVKSQRLVGKVHRVQTKTPELRPTNDSEDDSDSSIGSDSSMMSVEAAPKALIWKNDTSSSKKDRKVSHLRYVSTIHSLTSPMQRHHPNRRQSYHQLDKKHQQHLQPRQRSRYHRHSRAGYNDQPTQRRRGAAGKRSTMGTTKRNRDQDSRTNKSTPHLNPRGAEFESIRLATRIEEWYRNRAPDEELAELPAQKGILRISDTERAVQPSYLYDSDKDDRDLHRDHMDYDPPQRSSEWTPRPYSLSEIVYEYKDEDEGQRAYERDTQDHYHEIGLYLLNQYDMYLEDGGRRKYVHTHTGD